MEPANLIKKLPRALVYLVMGTLGLVAVLVVLTTVANYFDAQMGGVATNSNYRIDSDGEMSVGAMPAVAPGYGVTMEESYRDDAVSVRSASGMGGSMMPPIYPMPDYTPGLEDYETTSHYVRARTTDFDAACALLGQLKQDDAIHFSALSNGLNDCSSTFYVPKDRVDGVLNQFRAISGVDINSDTSSVTRVKENITSRTDIVRQQLADTEATLTEVTTQYEEIVALAYQKGDASGLNRAVAGKFELLDQLQQRRLGLASELQQLLQASADLDGRIDKATFSVSFTRAYPIVINEQSQQWEEAWKYLKHQATQTLIGLTLYLGVFALRALQFIFYGLILVVLARYLYKVVRVLWKH